MINSSIMSRLSSLQTVVCYYNDQIKVIKWSNSLNLLKKYELNC